MSKFTQITLLFLFTFSSHILLKAQDLNSIFSTSKTPITWIGIDFSHVKLVGSDGFKDPEAIVNRHFPSINYLIVEESDKYNLEKSFMKSEIDFNLEVTDNLNAEIDFIDLVINKSAPRLTKENLQSFADSYDFKGITTPVVLVFVAESLNKLAEKGTYHVVFINTTTREVIFTDRMSGEVGGMGFRNYWARPIYNILEQIRRKQFRIWRKANQS